MWPGIAHVARHLRGRLGLVQASECPQWEIVGRGLFKMKRKPEFPSFSGRPGLAGGSDHGSVAGAEFGCQFAAVGEQGVPVPGG